MYQGYIHVCQAVLCIGMATCVMLSPQLIVRTVIVAPGNRGRLQHEVVDGTVHRRNLVGQSGMKVTWSRYSRGCWSLTWLLFEAVSRKEAHWLWGL